jgi:hypothetical protein
MYWCPAPTDTASTKQRLRSDLRVTKSIDPWQGSVNDDLQNIKTESQSRE